jgi:hypothetical protein
MGASTLLKCTILWIGTGTSARANRSTQMLAGSFRAAVATALSVACLVGIAGRVVESSAAAPSPGITIPDGTILPVRVDQEISPGKVKSGQTVTGRVKQNVPLPSGQSIPARAKVIGHVESVTSSPNGAGNRIRLRWDRLKIGGQELEIRTQVRALASFMEVLDAETPVYSPGLGTPYNWAPTRLIGGGVKFGVGDVVTDTNSQVVGKGTQGGVLVHLEATSDCPTTAADGDRLQALWVFSADACGVYGIPGVTIVRNPQEALSRDVVLDFSDPKSRVRSGSGMLLEVPKSGSS